MVTFSINRKLYQSISRNGYWMVGIEPFLVKEEFSVLLERWKDASQESPLVTKAHNFGKLYDSTHSFTKEEESRVIWVTPLE